MKDINPASPSGYAGRSPTHPASPNGYAGHSPQELPVKVTEEMYAAIPELVAQGLTREQIAQKYSLTTNCLQVLCSRRNISLRKPPEGVKRPARRRMKNMVHVAVNYQVLTALQDASVRFGRTKETLVANLLEKIAADDLFVAILDEDEDDAHSKPAQPTQLEAY